MIGKKLAMSMRVYKLYYFERDADIHSLLHSVHGPFPGEASFLRATVPPGHPERAHHALLAGAIGGYCVWGRYSSVNHQVLLYLSSRVLMGLWKRSGQQAHPRLFSILAAAVWAIVMILFEESPEVLHPSLKSSMDEIYRYQLSPGRERGDTAAETSSAVTSLSRQDA